MLLELNILHFFFVLITICEPIVCFCFAHIRLLTLQVVMLILRHATTVAFPKVPKEGKAAQKTTEVCHLLPLDQLAGKLNFVQKIK